MHRWLAVGVSCLMVGVAMAQEAQAPSYTRGDNPFQGEFAIELGKPVTLNVEVQGVRLRTLTLTPTAEVVPGKEIRCDVLLDGENAGDAKATITTILLLEDSDSQALERVTPDSFRVRGGRTFEDTERVKVTGDALNAARKVYVFIEIQT